MANEEAEAVKEEVVAESTAPESAPEETEQSEEVEETESQEESSESQEEQETEAEETEQPKSKADQRKEQLEDEIKDLESKVGDEKTPDPRNTEIRDLVARRNELRQQVKSRNQQAYQAPTVESLLDQINPETGNYYSQLEAKLAIMEHNQKIDAYNNDVAEAQLTLSTEAERALKDFPMFDESSSEYNQELAQQVDQILGQALVFDQQTGSVIGSHVSPYSLYKAVAQSAQSGTVVGQLKAQKATQQMLNTADSSGGIQQSEKPFEKLSTAEMAERLRKKGHDV